MSTLGLKSQALAAIAALVLIHQSILQVERAHQEGLNGAAVLEAAEGVCLLLLIHRPVPECHACCGVMAHLGRMVRAALPSPGGRNSAIWCQAVRPVRTMRACLTCVREHAGMV